jgi:Flp pilus assembly protein TadB
VPSVSPRPQMARLGVLAVCALLLAGVATGCTTTQEKAARQQAQSRHILEARAERQKHKHEKSDKPHKDGSGKR